MSRFGFYRHPKTSQERKHHQSEWEDDIFVPIRGARKTRNLVDAWDDVPRHFQRSWKKQRRTQYKVADKTNKVKKDSSNYAKSMKKRDHWHDNHRWCACKSRRCKNCQKSGIWKSQDDYFERCRKRYQAKMDAWWTNRGII